MKKQTLHIKNKKVALVTHRSLLPIIPGDDLKKFLQEHEIKKLLYIKHPLLYLPESKKLSSEFEFYKNKKTQLFQKAFLWTLPEPLLMIKDFIYTIFWSLKTREVYDIYFGVNNLNALAGLVLKKFGRVKKVVYYTIDLFPQRFENSIVNFIYHRIDGLCVKHCDETWNVSPYLEEYRTKKGENRKKHSKQYTVPIGVWYEEMQRVPWEKVNKKKIVYVGHLTSFMGVDLAVRAIPVIKRKVPNIKLEIVGGGEEEDKLKKLVKKLKVDSYVSFHGWKEKKEAEEIMKDAAMGLAPFNTKIIDEKIKNADPAKIKDYLSLGIPVIMTDATINAKSIEEKNCGIVIDYTPKSFADAVVTLLSDPSKLQEYRKNAQNYARQFDWNLILRKNIERLIGHS